MFRPIVFTALFVLAWGGSYLYAESSEEQTESASQEADETWQKTNFMDDPSHVKRFVDKLIGSSPTGAVKPRPKAQDSADRKAQ